jgi:phage antirepressor YoqD-like protein
MNDLTNITKPATMTTREIAELCEKKHMHVMRDTRTMFAALDLDEMGYIQKWTDPQNSQQYDEFALPRDLTMTLVTGYSIPLRKKVIDRLDELEARKADPVAALNDPQQLRYLLLENVEKVLSLQSRVEEMTPTVEAYEQIAEAHGSLNRTETAKHLGVPPHVLCRWMRTNAWTYRRAGAKDDLAFQSKINAGLLEHKVTTGPRPDGTEWIGTQVRVTPKGLTVLAKAFPKQAAAA